MSPRRLAEAADTFVTRVRRARKTRELRGVERRLRQRLAALFARQGRSFRRNLAVYRDRLPEREPRALAESLTDREWAREWEKTARATSPLFVAALASAHLAALEAGALAAIADVGLDIAFDLSNPRAADWLRTQAAQRVTAITAETEAQLRTLITGAVEQGWSYSQLAAAIDEKFAGFGAARAQLIAVTETGDAYVQGNLAVAQDLAGAGIPLEKRWLTAQDSRVDDRICQPNADQGWIPMSASFTSGHTEPLGHPGCRCDLEIRVAVPQELQV